LQDETGYITGFELASLVFKEVKNFQKQNPTVWFWGHPVAQLAEALRYKTVDRGFNSRW